MEYIFLIREWVPAVTVKVRRYLRAPTDSELAVIGIHSKASSRFPRTRAEQQGKIYAVTDLHCQKCYLHTQSQQLYIINLTRYGRFHFSRYYENI